MRLTTNFYGDDNYTYWNVGLTFGFLEKWSLDFRYWDTNLDPAGACQTASSSATSGS